MRRLNAAAAAAIIALLGLVSAARAQSDDLYVLGIALFVACIGIVMLLIKQHFDAREERPSRAFLPSEPDSCFAVTFLLGLLALVGLVAATAPELYRVGLGIFVVSVIGAGAALKRGFDLVDRDHPRSHADVH
jgi:cobalamin synthase